MILNTKTNKTLNEENEMNNMHMYIIVSIICSLVVGGCKTKEYTPIPTTVSAVLVGVGYKCDKKDIQKKGSDLDISTMAEMINCHYVNSPYVYRGYQMTCLQDQDATLNNVTNAILKSLKSDLSIIYFSCKATQIKAVDSYESDGLDECIILYDGLLVDNVIWDILSNSSGNVFIIFDTGHSETLFRATGQNIASNDDITFFYDDSVKNNSNLNMICWSACGDDDTIDEREVGSRLTNTIYFKTERYDSYDDAFAKIQKSLNRKQKVKKTVFGKEFGSKTLFR